MFADIAGFTAWSSMRDPSQVFTLLGTIYCVFDKITDRRGVFKGKPLVIAMLRHVDCPSHVLLQP
jgi:class 3 adenylate cyclase